MSDHLEDCDVFSITGRAVPCSCGRDPATSADMLCGQLSHAHELFRRRVVELTTPLSEEQLMEAVHTLRVAKVPRKLAERYEQWAQLIEAIVARRQSYARASEAQK
jgi:hypothetical protein